MINDINIKRNNLKQDEKITEGSNDVARKHILSAIRDIRGIENRLKRLLDDIKPTK